MIYRSAPLVRALVDKTADRVCYNIWQKRVADVSSGERLLDRPDERKLPGVTG